MESVDPAVVGFFLGVFVGLGCALVMYALGDRPGGV
jgi:hypothetical protein